MRIKNVAEWLDISVERFPDNVIIVELNDGNCIAVKALDIL